MPAEVVSHYRLLGPLGSGGMGVVYRAEDTDLRRTVALKFLPEKNSSNPRVGERLRREARTASALNHPNICTIYEVGEDAGEVFIAMEYVEGRPLSELIRAGARPRPRGHPRRSKTAKHRCYTSGRRENFRFWFGS